MKSFRRVLGSIVGLILVLILTNTLALAQHAAKGDNGVNGQQAAADKQTGKLRQPSAEETKELLDGLTPLVNQSAEGLNVVKHDDGSLSVDLQDRFQNVAVAKIGADGKVEEKCVTSVAEAKDFLSRDAKPKDSKPEAKKPALEEK